MSQSGRSSGHADQRVEVSDDVLPPADIVTPKDNANEVTPPAGGEKEAAAAADALISNPIDRVDGIQSGEEAVNGGNKTTEEVPKVDGAQQSNHDNNQETEQTVAAKLEHKLKIDRREWPKNEWNRNPNADSSKKHEWNRNGNVKSMKSLPRQTFNFG